jgi:hypothetical protein
MMHSNWRTPVAHHAPEDNPVGEGMAASDLGLPGSGIRFPATVGPCSSGGLTAWVCTARPAGRAPEPGRAYPHHARTPQQQPLRAKLGSYRPDLHLTERVAGEETAGGTAGGRKCVTGAT